MVAYCIFYQLRNGRHRHDSTKGKRKTIICYIQTYVYVRAALTELKWTTQSKAKVPVHSSRDKIRIKHLANICYEQSTIIMEYLYV